VTHPRFDAILAAAVDAFGAPQESAETDSGLRRASWGNRRVVLLAGASMVYFIDPRTSGAWWIVDDATHGPTVNLSDAINDLRPLVSR
jgi:hypothetical protein